MEMFAYYMLDQIDCVLPTGQTLMNIAGKTDRYVLFKVGPVLIVSVSVICAVNNVTVSLVLLSLSTKVSQVSNDH